MKITRLLFAALAVGTVGSTAAVADTFSFSFGTPTTAAFSGSGTLTGSLIAPGEYLITAASGTTQTGNGVNHTISLEAPGTFPTAANGGAEPPNDNDLFLNAGVYSFDNSGLSYLLDNGAQVNLALSSFEYLERRGGATVIEAVPISISAVTPEPGSLLLMGTGMLGTLGLLRRRLQA